MDLNDIELPPGLITSFYKNHLVEAGNTGERPRIPPVAGSISQKDIQFLGKNQKGICLLVDYPGDVYLPDEQLNFLTTILQACKLNLGDVAIVNYHLHKMNFEDLMQKTGCRHLLIFGIDPVKLELGEIAAFSIAQKNNYTILVSSSIETLNNNNTESKLLKSKLWICLKQLFIA